MSAVKTPSAQDLKAIPLTPLIGSEIRLDKQTLLEGSCATYAAWEQLPAQDKKQLEGLRAMHSAWTTLFYYDPEPSLAKVQELMNIGEQELPLVCKHRSGRKSLVLGCTAHHVIGMSARDSTELPVRLREWATQPQFTYRHKWTVRDLVMWDNTGTMHRATPYPPDSGRMLHRTKLMGEEPFQ